MAKLNLAAETAGSDSRIPAQRRERRTIGDESVTGILALWDCAKHNSRGKLERNILHAVDSKIDSAIQQRLVDFLRKESLSADLCQRNIEDLVARRLDRHKFYSQVRPALLQLALRPVRLPKGQGASAGSKPESADVHCGLTLKICSARIASLNRSFRLASITC